MRFAFALLPVSLATLACSATAPQAGVPARAATLSEGPRLSAPRATHALVRSAAGPIVALGGCVADGCEPGPASATVDVFAADGSRRLRTGTLMERRVQPAAAALPDGRVLVIGGWVGGSVSATTELFDPRTGRSAPGPALAHPRSSPVVVALGDGTVMIAGGYDGATARADAELFDPASGTLRPAGPMVHGRSGATGTRLGDGRILIAGGSDGERAGRRVVAQAELYDPRTRRFTATASLLTPRYKHGAVALPNGDALIVGGSDVRDYGGKLRAVERYDAMRGRFVPAGALAVTRFKLTDGVMLLDPGHVLVAAGDERPELFDIAERRGRLLDADLGGQWNYLTALPLGGHAAFLAGGYREGRIEPTDRTWRLKL